MRCSNWETLLAEYLDKCLNKPFVWGEHDCCLFAANVIKIITGVDFAAPFRGKYSTQLGAIRALKRYGSGDLTSTLNMIFGEPVSKLNVRRGDVALVANSGEPAMAIVFNGLWYVGVNGLVKTTMTDALVFWRVD